MMRSVVSFEFGLFALLALACASHTPRANSGQQAQETSSEPSAALAPSAPVVLESASSDRDGDGVADQSDACPERKGVMSADKARNGCPEGPLDADEDGIADDKDGCPREAASRAAGSPSNGCPGKGPAEAIFTGFTPHENGAATVFVQLSDSVKVDVVEGKGAFSYVMKGASVLRRNNKNPLVVSEFDSNVRRAQLVAEKGAVRLVVEFKESAKPSFRMARQGKAAVLEVEVPPPVVASN
ncbi:MAG TPA: thrombospondin type 3 repeat-containing protein [Polyangiaceae bacterium]|jgi:hypothetical protein|nr:thrombospondin type 3 repeat-containing protein [Polyangiaceae bacterium]